MSNPRKFKHGERVYISGLIEAVGVSPINQYECVKIGHGISQVIIRIHHDQIIDVPLTELQPGDDVMWNTTKCKILAIDGEDAWVQLYSGSKTNCSGYKKNLRLIPKGQ